MNERIVNIFTYGNDKYVQAFGFCAYIREGSYQELTAYLKSRASQDFNTAHRIELPKSELRSVIELAVRLNSLHHIAPRVSDVIGDSVYCITHVVDGQPQTGEIHHAPPHEIVPDYLSLYWTDSGFDFGQMIDDDFIDAMRVLWQRKKYISALKLLVIMIDTLGFVEFGPKDSCFVMWLDKYCDLTPLSVSSQELWELRNSLTHMTNLDSRKVRKGKVKRLLPIVIDAQNEIPVEADDFKCLHLSRLFQSVIPFGLKKWAQTIGGDREKFLSFIQRYDTLVSDTRVSVSQRVDNIADL